MEHGLKLKPLKCNCFRTEISSLGHKVSVAGMEPGTDGLKGIAKIAPPATYTHLYSRTTDEYITSLYDKLKSALASVRDTALLEAQRQKWLYNHKELELGVHLFVKQGKVTTLLV